MEKIKIYKKGEIHYADVINGTRKTTVNVDELIKNLYYGYTIDEIDNFFYKMISRFSYLLMISSENEYYYFNNEDNIGLISIIDYIRETITEVAVKNTGN